MAKRAKINKEWFKDPDNKFSRCNLNLLKKTQNLTQSMLDDLASKSINPILLNVMYALCVLFDKPQDPTAVQELLRRKDLLERVKRFDTSKVTVRQNFVL